MSPSPSASRADLIRVLSCLAGIAAAVSVAPDAVTNRVLTQAASVASFLSSPPAASSSSSSSSSPASFLSSALDSAAAYVDQTTWKLRLRSHVDDFDAVSPVDHRVIVRLAVGVLVMGGTRLLCTSLLR